MVQFLQINLHHSKAAFAALLIKESWIVGNNICGLLKPQQKLFYIKGKGKSRTSILTKTHISAFLIQTGAKRTHTPHHSIILSGSRP